ncbi:hypothetical protein [Cellulophaga omnivescoria]|uniref:hypothetical protein n=1 Tax=Cellulophaga omnivescoria TaxID=1888890 RepID=UPI000987C96B|nr:hypothetical protein [Cellulophaga omnivescoria]WBU88283.1 hypothetical protein PBN93_10425 [Cellulophaga omnivescoria]
MVKNIVVLMFLFVVSIVCAQQKTEDVSLKEMKQVWATFLSTLKTKDTVKFKRLSALKIRCYACLENTPEEEKELTTFRDTEEDWYSALYTTKIYIPVDTFIAEDYNLIFTHNFIGLLVESETIYVNHAIDGVNYIEVLVTTTKPTKFHEGGQHTFRFVKQNKIWVLDELSTIP